MTNQPTSFVGRLLCSVGVHDWENYVGPVYDESEPTKVGQRCSRCHEFRGAMHNDE